MTDDQFEQWLLSQRPALEAFGELVVSEVTRLVRENVGEERARQFFKVTPNSRVKEIKSALKKQKKKKYADPTVQMTDFVGARFVVLLRSDIEIVQRAIVNCRNWTARRDREPKLETELEPDAFRYQSTHFVVHSSDEIEHNGVKIPAQTACEIQVRTLLQHAYAELGHDRIYKEEGVVPASVHRIVAKSMALMETTDELFCQAVEELSRVNKDVAQWCTWMDSCFKGFALPYWDSQDDEETVTILETFQDILITADHDDVRQLFDRVGLKRARDVPVGHLLFKRPVVMVLYWLIQNHLDETKRRWPLPKFVNDVELVAADLGMAW